MGLTTQYNMCPVVHLYPINYNLRIGLNIMSLTQIYHKIKTTFLNTHIEKGQAIL